MVKKLEVLAPAGSWECLEAAVYAGADAIYLGGAKFGARAFADNFTEEKLINAIEFAHLHGKKIYLTINTLFKDKEIEELYDYLLPYYKHGLDAVIVQDVGVMNYIRNQFPDLAIHVSTQATVTSAASAEYFKNKGVTRVVPARELSLEEVNHIKRKTGLEIECFVHGALCYCYSGQCLLSSYIGGRSGNRGQCAQPCRLNYSCNGKSGDYLSLKDLCTIHMIPEIAEAGIDSFKIEGRMKQPEYVYTVSKMYRKYCDLYLKYGSKKYKVSSEDEELLKRCFQRRGYTEGYYKQHNNKNMISFVQPKERDNKVLLGNVEKNKISVEAFLFLQKDVPSVLTLNYKNVSITVEGKAPEVAKSQPLNRERIEKQLKKTGNTNFVFKNLYVEIEDDLFIPMQAINELRRTAIEKLFNEIVSQYDRDVPDKKEIHKKVFGDQKCMIQLSSLVTQKEQLEEIKKYEEIGDIYIDSGIALDLSENELSGDRKYFCALPYIFRDNTASYFDQYYESLYSQYDGMLVRNWESIQWLRKHGYEKEIHTDYNLYVFNTLSKENLLQENVSLFTASLELNYHELKNLGVEKAALSIYGYQPAMITANCITKTSNVCQHRDDVIYLLDRYRKKMPVRNVCRECYNVIYNSSPLFLLHHRKQLQDLNPFSVRLDFTIEDRKRVSMITELCIDTMLKNKDISTPDFEFTNGHFKRGVK